jgi:hypothetical protein
MDNTPFHASRHCSTALLALSLWLHTAIVGAAGLPAHMEFHYRLLYGDAMIGETHRTLDKQADGSYRHQLHSIPRGLARMFTSVEWFEEGVFRLTDGQVQPLSFLMYRVGASKPHRHSAEFDWEKKQVRYSNGNVVPLPPNCQDQGSVVFYLMLNAAAVEQSRELYISGGKRITTYHYRYLRTEELETVLGRVKTRVVEWSPQEKTRDGGEIFTAWLAVDKGNIPVKIVTQDQSKTATMLLDSAQGL